MTLTAWTHARRQVRRLKASQAGATAVEFAMVAGPFFFLLFGLLEICLVFIISTVMEQAADDAARAIRTGAYTGTDGVPLQADICTGMLDLFNCDAALRVQVNSPTSFATAIADDYEAAPGVFKDQSGITYDDGAGGDIVVVRVLFRWELITPVISQPLSNWGNARLIQSTVVFRNEPF